MHGVSYQHTLAQLIYMDKYACTYKYAYEWKHGIMMSVSACKYIVFFIFIFVLICISIY